MFIGECAAVDADIRFAMTTVTYRIGQKRAEIMRAVSGLVDGSRLIKRAWFGGLGRFVRRHPFIMLLARPVKSFVKRKVVQSTMDDRTLATGGVKLHVGCGANPLPGWFNVDITDRPGLAFRCDLNTGLPLADRSIDEIYCCHVLEHFATSAVPDILREFARVLRSPGILRVAVPDLDTICRCYSEHIDWFTPPHNPWLGLFYGGQTDRFDFHKTGFNFRWLEHLLHQAEFHGIRTYQPEEMYYNLRDASFADEPFGVRVSLNVLAVRN